MSADSPWVVADAGGTYYARVGSNVVEHFEAAGAPTTREVATLERDVQIVSLAVVDGHLLIETNVFGMPNTTLQRLDPEEGEPSIIVRSFRRVEAAGEAMIVHEGVVLSTDVGGELRGHELDSGAATSYVAAGARLCSASGGFAYYVHRTGAPDARYPSSVRRIDIAGGTTEEVLQVSAFEMDVAFEHQGQLFWTERARLLRRRLDANDD